MAILAKERFKELEQAAPSTEDAAEAIISAVGKDADARDLQAIAMRASTDELRELIIQRAQELSQMKREQGFTDPTRLSGGVDLSEGRIREMLDEALEASKDGFGNLPDVDKGAMVIETKRFRVEAPKTGPTITALETVKEASQPRYCVAGYYQQKTGRNLRAIRLEVILPPRGLQPEEVNQIVDADVRAMARRIPQPLNQDGTVNNAKAKRLAAADNLRDWQEGKITQAVINFCKETGRIQVFTDPESRTDVEGFSSYTVLCMDEEEVRRFSGDVGRVHYLSGLVSGNGTAPNGDPDYRTINYAALTPEEAAPLAELLGTGVYEAGKIGDGRGMILLPEWPTDEDGNALHHWALEVQDRMIFGWDQDGTGEELDENEEGFRLGFSKGMHRPYHPQALKQAVSYYKQLPDDQKPRYRPAYDLIRQAQKNGKPVAVAIRSDQIKIGADRVPKFGVALMGCTYLKGTHDTQVVERVDYDEDSPTYGETVEVRVPKPQYTIAGGSQIIQLLSPTGHQAIAEHVTKEVDILARKCKSLPGIAEIASESTAQRLQDMQTLAETGSMEQQMEAAQGEQYQAGADQLTDAILGGGVRQKAKDLIQTLQGEVGTMQMLPSTRRRFDRILAAYVRRHIYKAFGIYGFGFHHATVENSTGLLWRMWNNYSLEGISESSEYLKRSAGGHTPIKNPVADRSAIVMPRKVTGLMNADDDGDLTNSMAAHMNVPGCEETIIVILTWRYPCVDVPILWAMPKEAPCPFLGRDQEERERFERVIRAFGPEMQATEITPDGEEIPTPGIYEEDITRLKATQAYRLANKGAKSGKKTRREGPLTQKSAAALVNAKRNLNMAGPLTRDLERLGDLMALCIEKMYKMQARGSKQGVKMWKREFQVMRSRAVKCSRSIEQNLTAFKYKMKGRITSPDLTSDLLGIHDDRFARQHFLPMSYHNDYGRVVATVEAHRRIKATTPPSETSLELYEGPEDPCRQGTLLQQCTESDVPKLIEALENIETDVQPFRMALSRKLKRWQKDVYEKLGEEKAIQRFKDAKAESDRVLDYCNFYRSFWRQILDETQAMVDQAVDKEQAEEQRDQRISLAGRHIHLVMQAMSQNLSPEGLAHGVMRDWNSWTDNQGNERSNSPAAGMALITGRMGEVFIPQSFMVGAPLADTRTKHTVVWRSGDPLPVAEIGTRRKATSVRVDTENRVIALELEADDLHEESELVSVNVDEDQPLPDGFPDSIAVYLCRVSDAQGVLLWRHE